MTALPTTDHAPKGGRQWQKCHNRPQAAVISLWLLGLGFPLLLPQVSMVVGVALLLGLSSVMACIRPLRPLAVTFCVAAVVIVNWSAQQLPDSCWGKEVTVTGRVVGLPRVTGPDLGGQYVQRFDINATSTTGIHCTPVGLIKLSLWQHSPVIQAGQLLTMQVRLRPPPSQWSPGAVPDGVSSVVDAVVARGTVSAVVHVQTPSQGSWAALRGALAAQLQQQLGETRASALLAALALGDARRLDTDDWRQFRVLGIVHVLVISGLHVGLVYLMARAILIRVAQLLVVPFWPSVVRQVLGSARMLALLMAMIYGLLGGAGVPVVRAMIFLAVYEGVRLLGWRTSALRVLGLVTLLLVTTDPLAILDQSLWLSVSATAIVITVGRLNRALLAPDKGAVITVLLTQLLAQLCMLPLMAPWLMFWLGELSTVSLLGNVLLVPLISMLVIPSALLGDIWALLLPLTVNLPWIMASGILEQWLRLADTLHHAVASEALLAMPLSLWEFLLVLSLVGVWWVHSSWRRPLVSTLCVLLCIGGVRLLPRFSDTANLWLLDVGQGLSVLWQQAGQTLLFDTGWGSPAIPGQVRKVVLPAMRALGIEQLDHLVISHADDDHSGGLATLQSQIVVNSHWGYDGQPCRPGAILWRSEEGYAQFLSGNGQSHDERNTHSCVLLLQFQGVRVLVTGDIPMAQERSAVRYWRDNLEASVLVVAHHGSSTSTGATFLKWVQPQWALISAGRYNRFGHPAQDVLDRLDRANIKALNSAESGSVQVTLGERGVEVRALRTGWVPFWLQIPPLGRAG